jgi:ATP-binding cassette subfamily C protein
VLRDLDLAIPAGDHLAVVGPSGIGKSTLAALIAGTLTPDAGQVHLGGVPAATLDPVTRRALRVLIPQQAYVFAGSVAENLTYLADGATAPALDHAVDALGARDLVRRAGGYDAALDPASLSAGERQLVALVRAYLSTAPVVMLDEATCHLDPAAEARAERAFAERTGTLVVIAHRISSALRADRILVLDGKRVWLGRHESLRRDCPLYRDLVGLWGDPASAGWSQATRGPDAEVSRVR